MNIKKKTNKSNILVVDDTYANLKYLTSFLSEQGYYVRPVLNGRLALSGAQSNAPDLMLLDIRMPEMDGYEVCRRLKANPDTKEIPVIFLSAADDTDDVVKGFNAGAVDYITKPFNQEILLARIKTHLALREKTKQLHELSTQDGLTGIANRRSFDSFLETEWKRCLRANAPISLIMADIDYFKQYNDRYGHQKGDDALKKVAQTIKQFSKRASDLTARYGGEEFAVILGNTDAETAKTIAGRTCLGIESLNIPHESSNVKSVVTVSLGVSTMIPDAQFEPCNLIALADDQLYKAKGSGRNTVKHCSDQS
jgi:diguanylate cyclase (GGDEF)-like protein